MYILSSFFYIRSRGHSWSCQSDGENFGWRGNTTLGHTRGCTFKLLLQCGTGKVSLTYISVRIILQTYNMSISELPYPYFFY